MAVRGVSCRRWVAPGAVMYFAVDTNLPVRLVMNVSVGARVYARQYDWLQISWASRLSTAFRTPSSCSGDGVVVLSPDTAFPAAPAANLSAQPGARSAMPPLATTVGTSLVRAQQRDASSSSIGLRWLSIHSDAKHVDRVDCLSGISCLAAAAAAPTAVRGAAALQANCPAESSYNVSSYTFMYNQADATVTSYWRTPAGQCTGVSSPAPATAPVLASPLARSGGDGAVPLIIAGQLPLEFRERRTRAGDIVPTDVYVPAAPFTANGATYDIRVYKYPSGWLFANAAPAATRLRAVEIQQVAHSAGRPQRAGAPSGPLPRDSRHRACAGWQQRPSHHLRVLRHC